MTQDRAVRLEQVARRSLIKAGYVWPTRDADWAEAMAAGAGKRQMAVEVALSCADDALSLAEATREAAAQLAEEWEHFITATEIRAIPIGDAATQETGHD